MVFFQTLIHKEPMDYDGKALAPHWIYRKFDILGDALVAFVGNADVPIENMVDLEDVNNNDPIYSPKMLHFLAEWFQGSFEEALLMQMVLIHNIYETLWQTRWQTLGTAKDLKRRGNDIYVEGKKLSVSIVTKSVTSYLMHTGVNIETQGTPVPTAGLSALGIEPFAFASEVIERVNQDLKSCAKSRVKVRPREM